MILLRDAEPEITQQQVFALLSDDDRRKRAAFEVLSEVQKHPEIANRVAAAYRKQQSKMFTPELMLAVGVLVILAIKIKEIRWAEDEKVVSFYDSSEAIRAFVSGLLKENDVL